MGVSHLAQKYNKFYSAPSAVSTEVEDPISLSLEREGSGIRGNTQAGAATQLSVHKITRYANQWYILSVVSYMRGCTYKLRISFRNWTRDLLLTNVWQLRRSESQWTWVLVERKIAHTIYIPYKYKKQSWQLILLGIKLQIGALTHRTCTCRGKDYSAWLRLWSEMAGGEWNICDKQ